MAGLRKSTVRLTVARSLPSSASTSIARPSAKSANVESTPPWTVPRWLAWRSSVWRPSTSSSPSAASRIRIGPMCSKNGPWLGKGEKPEGGFIAMVATPGSGASSTR
jgi:hypothetical protein